MRTRHAEQDDLHGVHHPAADPNSINIRSARFDQSTYVWFVTVRHSPPRYGDGLRRVNAERRSAATTRVIAAMREGPARS